MKINVLRSARNRFTALIAATLCAGLGFTANDAHAATILKMSLSDVGPDVATNLAILATANDGNAATTGDQNTTVDFTSFLGGIPDITTPTASASLGNLIPAGPASQFGSLVIQNYTGGFFNLYDGSNTLLLSINLGNSALTGTAGAPATGSVFTTSFATATGGTLLPLINPGTISLSMDLIDVNGGAGFSVNTGALQPFSADGQITIAADPEVGIPEPASLSLALAGLAALTFRRKHRN
jgi:hypothetical protein